MAVQGSAMLGGSLTFDHRVQEWNIFKSRFTQYCEANDVNQETDKAGVKRRALLLTALVEDTYRVARDLVFPKAVEELEYSKLLDILDKHFKGKRSSFGERLKFSMAQQRPGEEISEWAARVRNLAQHCGYKTELVEVELRDRFVLGLVPSKEKEKLFAEDVNTLTFNKAVEIAQSVRCARLALHSAQSGPGSSGESSAQPVFAMRARPTSAPGGGSGGRGASADRLRDSPRNNASAIRCEVCGYRNHSKEKCRYIDYTCRKCNSKGHLMRMCKSGRKNQFYLAVGDDDTIEGNFDLFSIECVDGKPMRQMVTMSGVNILCEIDSGSAVSVLPLSTYQTCFELKHKLASCNVVLNCYNGSRIMPVGCVELSVTFEGRTESIRLFIIKANDGQPALLGRDFISTFGLKLCSTSISCNNLGKESIENLLTEKYSELFKNELGRFNKYKITLRIKSDAQLKFFKHRPVPLALKPKVEKELERLLQLGILEKVEHSEIATPIVPVLRSDGDIRICGDFSVTLNKVLCSDSYPLPRIEDLFANLYGGEEFTKLDLSRAYNQLELDDTKHLTCINTHKGLFRFNRLVFGLANAPFIFQRTIEQLLRGIEGISIFIDDILITGPNREIHLKRLEEVFSRLQDAGLRLRADKCELFKDSVEYLGFRIDKTGLHKSQKKVDAILNCNSPKNEKEVKSFLGMVNYYRCFVPNTSSVLSPLHDLLKKGIKWNWGEVEESAFKKIKEELASERVLAHYSPELPTVVTADAGPAGLGAVLAQIQPDGSERVVAYASRSLSKAERNYAQIQKEATAIVFSIKKFHNYLYGRIVPFTLRTDHKPLLSIFGCKKGVPEMAANRLQRYALFLSAYNFKIEYIKSDDNVADFLSRSVIGDNGETDNQKVDGALYINFITDYIMKPLTIDIIRNETEQDDILKKVGNYIRNGWPKKNMDPDLNAYFVCRNELTIENGCLLRGHKLIIPTIFRERLLDELHFSHFGVVKTKAEARTRMWWPSIDKHIEQKIGSCSVCNTLRSAPPRSPLATWPYPARPWERVHLDMLSLEGKQFMVAIDAHSKWLECYLMRNTDSEAIITKLGELFSRFGLVRSLVTDNASNFCSKQFEDFCVVNGIQHLTIAPYHPQSNGQAENSVKTVKKALKIILEQTRSQKVLLEKMNKFLFNYRNSIHGTTGFSPAQLLFGRPLRCRLDLLQVRGAGREQNKDDESPRLPSTHTAKLNVCSKQILQSEKYGGHRRTDFKVNDKVLIKQYYKNGSKHTWKKGVIQGKIGSRMYNVFVPEVNSFVRKHVDQIVAYKGEETVYDIDDISSYGDYENKEDGNADIPDDQSSTSDVQYQASKENQEGSSDSSFRSIEEEQSPDVPSRLEGEGDREDGFTKTSDAPLTSVLVGPQDSLVTSEPQSGAQSPKSNKVERPKRAARNKIVNYKD